MSEDSSEPSSATRAHLAVHPAEEEEGEASTWQPPTQTEEDEGEEEQADAPVMTPSAASAPSQPAEIGDVPRATAVSAAASVEASLPPAAVHEESPESVMIHHLSSRDYGDSLSAHSSVTATPSRSTSMGALAAEHATAAPSPSAAPLSALTATSLPSSTRSSGAAAPMIASGNYQSLSASFGEVDPDSAPASVGTLASGPQPAITRKSGARSRRASMSSPDALAGSGATGVASSPPSISVDLLTGRTPLPATSGPSTPLKYGWLKKEGEGVLGGWKKRWVVVSRLQLDFFKEMTDEKSQGSVPLLGASIFVEDKTDLHIMSVRASKRVSFRCESEFERNAWVKLLTDLSSLDPPLLEAAFDAATYADWSAIDVQQILLPAMVRLLGKVGTMSSIWGIGDGGNVGVLLSGPLTKMGDKVKNFKKRYCVLVGKLLIYFDSEDSYLLTDAGGAPQTTYTNTPAPTMVPPVLGTASSPSPSLSPVSSPASSPRAASYDAPASSKGSHGKEVLASLARSHLRAQRRSITPLDLQNHHIIRRQSQLINFGDDDTSLAAAVDEGKRRMAVQKRILKGEGKPPLGIIMLHECTLSLQPMPGRPFGFGIRSRDRTYHLFTETEAELRAWYYMLSLVTQSLPIQRYMKSVLELELSTVPTMLHSPWSTRGDSRSIAMGDFTASKPPPLVTDEQLAVLKTQLTATMLDPTCVRFLHCYWLERQSFHEPRTHPFLFPLETPLTLRSETGARYFDGLLIDEAGDRGENALSLPLYYFHFWLDVQHWATIPEPTELDGGDQPNAFASAQDPSLVLSCVPLPVSYRQHRCEEIIDRYLSHGAPYPIYLDHDIRDRIFSESLRGPNAPNRLAPSATLFKRAQELVTELIAVEVFPRYLKSRNSAWSYLSSIAAQYDETLIRNRAEQHVEALCARVHDAETYAALSIEEQEASENDRLAQFQNLLTLTPKELDTCARDCAEQAGHLPNTDSTKIIYHSYLYALQRLREYHALFSIAAATPSLNQPPIALTLRRTHAAKAFFHDFLLPGSPFALCIPEQLTQDLMPLLSDTSPRRQFLFANIEHCILTELTFACQETKDKVRQQVEIQRSPLKFVTNPMSHAAVRRAHTSSRSTVAARAAISPNTPFRLTYDADSCAAASSVVLLDSDVPFNCVFGMSPLFTHFRRFSLVCRHIQPRYLWDQVALVARIFDYRHLSEPKVMTAYARQVYAQYLSENAPHKVNFTKETMDRFKTNISLPSPGPHVFIGVLQELYGSLDHLYTTTFKTQPFYSASYACLQEDFGLCLRDEICVTQGKRDFNFDANVSLMSSNKNAATWFDIRDFRGSTQEIDEGLANLSAHQALWTKHLQTFLNERFCGENAEFFVEADDHRRCPGPAYRILRAKRLYMRYISETAQLQVNVPSWVARELKMILQRDGVGAGAIAPSQAQAQPVQPVRPMTSRPSVVVDRSDVTASSPLLFIAAQREIFLLIRSDNLKPFLHGSEPWKAYKAVCQARM